MILDPVMDVHEERPRSVEHVELAEQDESSILTPKDPSAHESADVPPTTFVVSRHLPWVCALALIIVAAGSVGIAVGVYYNDDADNSVSGGQAVTMAAVTHAVELPLTASDYQSQQTFLELGYGLALGVVSSATMEYNVGCSVSSTFSGRRATVVFTALVETSANPMNLAAAAGSITPTVMASSLNAALKTTTFSALDIQMSEPVVSQVTHGTSPTGTPTSSTIPPAATPTAEPTSAAPSTGPSPAPTSSTTPPAATPTVEPTSAAPSTGPSPAPTTDAPTTTGPTFIPQNTGVTEIPHNLPETDYMSLLGEDEAAHTRQPFMAENRMYYLAEVQQDTIGLLHAYWHDLKSRGTGIAQEEGVDKDNAHGGIPRAGVGDDYNGWEWWRATKVAAGTIVDSSQVMPWGEYMRWETPPATRMWWRPDKVIAEYDLVSPYISGINSGWCSPGSMPAGQHSFYGWYSFDDASECFQVCEQEVDCSTAVYEWGPLKPACSGRHCRSSQCWLGTNRLTQSPVAGSTRCDTCYNATCYSKSYSVKPVTVREEKFLGINEAAGSIITASRSVSLEIIGRSWQPQRDSSPVINLTATCSHSAASDTIRVQEGGTVYAQVVKHALPAGYSPIYKVGPFVLEGMNGVIGSSRPMERIHISNITYQMTHRSFSNATQGTITIPAMTLGGICEYNFSVTLDSNSTTISYAMDDDYSTALSRVQNVVANSSAVMAKKTDKMNYQLNHMIPYFNCSDRDIVKVYYYLWSVYLMLYINVGRGLESRAHTQTAANNFLGMHRYDAVFQIMVGAWSNPAYHEWYANGNVLVWEGVYNRGLNRGSELPDNFGQDWGSAIFGPEACNHVLGAFDIFEHSGDHSYLAQAYSFYKSLFWDNMCFVTMGPDAVLTLNKMAVAAGFPEDVAHWNSTTGMEWYENNVISPDKNWWESDLKDMWGSTGDGTNFGARNIAFAGNTQFNRTWVERMASTWMDDDTNGFFSTVPLASVPLQNWHKDDGPDGAPNCPLGPKEPACTGGVDHDFTIVPDLNFYMIRPFYMHKVSWFANKALLAHLKRYNMQNGMPVAPEARRIDNTEFGNQFNNFNAGKIQLMLQGLSGIKISNSDDTFTFADNLPSNWTYMEYQVPVRKNNAVVWVKARAERVQNGNTVTKRVFVENNPFSRLRLQPWAEEALLTSSTPSRASIVHGHAEFSFDGQTNATVEMSLDYTMETRDLTQWDGSLEAQGLTTKIRDYYACQPNCKFTDVCAGGSNVSRWCSPSDSGRQIVCKACFVAPPNPTQ